MRCQLIASYRFGEEALVHSAMAPGYIVSPELNLNSLPTLGTTPMSVFPGGIAQKIIASAKMWGKIYSLFFFSRMGPLS